MPEPGELVTTQRIFGIETIMQHLADLTGVVESLRGEVRQAMTEIQDIAQSLRDALNNIASGVEDLIARLDAAIADTQDQIDAAKAEQLAGIVAEFQPLADQARALAEATPDAPPPPVE